MLHVSHIYATHCLLLFIIFYCLSCYIIEWTNRKSIRRVCVSAWHASFSIDFFGPPRPYHPLAVYPDNVYFYKIWFVCTFNLFWNAIRRLLVCCDNVTTCACRPEIYLKACPSRRRGTILHTHTHTYTMIILWCMCITILSCSWLTPWCRVRSISEKLHRSFKHGIIWRRGVGLPYLSCVYLLWQTTLGTYFVDRIIAS